MNKSENITNIAKSLATFQAEVQDPEKNKVLSHLKSKYVGLDDLLQSVRPVLSKHGISFLQIPSSDDETVSVTTLLMHSSGEFIESYPFTLKLVKKDPQGVGSAVTYARRYSLSSILGVAWDEDDDAQSNTESAVNTMLINEIVQLATASGIDTNKLSDYVKTTFNKPNCKALETHELNQVKSWVSSL